MATDPTKSKQAPASHDGEGQGEASTLFSEVTDPALPEDSPSLQADGSTDSKSMANDAHLMNSTTPVARANLAASRDVNRRSSRDAALQSTHNEQLKCNGVTSLHVRSFLLVDLLHLS